jgi:hypothetical protein
VTQPAVVEWLLEGDPAIRWQVRRDLLDEPDAVVADERSAVAAEGWGARLLAEQDRDGTWASAIYSPKWTSTTYTLLLLRQLGLASGHPAALIGCQRILDAAHWFDGGLNLAKTIREPETCITSIVVSLAAGFGFEEDRIDDAMVWLLGQQLEDGGWNCETVRCGSRHGSFNTTILALEAIAEWVDARGSSKRLLDARRRGLQFFVDHRLYCAHRTGEVVADRYTRLVFPTGWHHDLLRGLDTFVRAGAPAHPELAGAIARLQERRRGDGTWAGNRTDPGRQWFVLEPAVRPSRVHTLRALRALRWWERSSP